jgi:NDP-sugar pyrophosphorylase family protein
MQIIIPMTGIGKRFVNAGYILPKPIIEVDGKPMIEHVINLFPGETNIITICNDKHIQVPDVIKKICPSARIFQVEYTGQGPVETVLRIENEINDDAEVIVSYCDYGTKWDYKKFLDCVRSQNADGGIPCYRGFHPHNLGPDMYAFVKETRGIITAIQEKKCFTDNKLNEYASNGTYYFRTGAIMKKYFHSLEERINGELYVSLTYSKMIQDGLKVVVFEIEKMLQWGTPYDLEVYKTWSNYFHEPARRRIKAPGITLLPMAGRGSRFRMQGYDTPKPLLPVRGCIMAVSALNDLPETDTTTIISLREHNISTYFPGKKIVELEETTNGQATTCILGLEGVDDNTQLTITACDNGAMYNPDILENMINDSTIDVIVWCFTNNPTGKLYPQMYAWLDVDKEGNIHDVSIKTPFSNRPNTHAIIGTMFFRTTKLFKDGYDYIVKNDIRTNGEYYVDNILKPLIDKGCRVKAFEVDYYLCWGTPNDYRTYLYWEDYHTSSH